MVVDEFAYWHVASGDVDPVYPALGWLGGELGLDRDDHTAFVLLYVAYYNLSSALRAWLEGWRPGRMLSEEQLRYPTGVERRAHRDVRQFARHIESLNRCLDDGVVRFVSPLSDDPWTRWQEVQHQLSLVHGNGRWAGYKAGEILDTVLGFGCPPPDAGHANSSGPRHGLADIFPNTAELTGNSPAVIARLDEYTDRLVERWDIPVAQVETVLCDWHSTVHGNYYVGHDIDLMLGQAAASQHRETVELILMARHDRFSPRWLGERRGWDGVRKPLKRMCLDTGRIDWWT